MIKTNRRFGFPDPDLLSSTFIKYQDFPKKSLPSSKKQNSKFWKSDIGFGFPDPDLLSSTFIREWPKPGSLSSVHVYSRPIPINSDQFQTNSNQFQFQFQPIPTNSNSNSDQFRPILRIESNWNCCIPTPYRRELPNGNFLIFSCFMHYQNFVVNSNSH